MDQPSAQFGLHWCAQGQDICEFDSFGQQVNEAAGIIRAQGFSPICLKVVAGEIGQKVDRIDHCDHGIKARNVWQASAVAD